MKDKFIETCPYCGQSEFFAIVQGGYGAAYSAESQWHGDVLNHTVCRTCGSVVRSYVTDPEKFFKRSERKIKNR